MKIKSRLIVLSSSVLFALGGFAYGSGINNVSSSQVIYACVTGVNGNISRVSNTEHTCPRGTTPIWWNQQGIQGNTGPVGATGATGPAGPVNSSKGLVPWYLADANNNPVAVPLNPVMMPDGPDGSVQVMLNGMVATVDYVTGKVWSAGDVGDISAALYDDADCTGSAMAMDTQLHRYIELSDGSRAFVGSSVAHTVGESRSTTNPLVLKELMYNSLAQQGFGTENVDILTSSFKGVSNGSGCYNLSLTNLENYAYVNFAMNSPFPVEGTQVQVDAWNQQELALKNAFLNMGLMGMTSVPLLPDFGPLHMVSNY